MTQREKHGNVGQPTSEYKIRRMRGACWIHKTTKSHSKYATILAFPPQQRLRKRAPVSRYVYLASLVYSMSGLLV